MHCICVHKVLNNMGIYRPGRPFRYYPHEERGTCQPHKPGEYRINGSGYYIGETNDLYRRMRQHMQSGKIMPGDYFEYMVADGRYSVDSRRKHEQEKIDKYNPLLNRRRGGGGRKP